MNYYWAPGHSTGFMVKTCEVCGKTVSEKINCCKCGKEIVDNEIHIGDGERLALGASYCEECGGIK